MNDHVKDQEEQALAELEAYLDEQGKKMNKRFWGKLSIPFNLQEGLQRYPKYELDEIRKELNLQKASQLRKDELVARLEEEITGGLHNLISTWDEERFALLVRMANNQGQLALPDDMDFDQINYLRRQGIVFSGMVNDRKVLALPEDLIEPLKSLKDNMTVRKVLKRNTEWILLTRGLLYYYGVLTINQLTEMVITYTKEDINILEYLTVLHKANDYHEEFSVTAEGFEHVEVIDAARVKQEQQARADIDYYPFTKQQLVKAGEPLYVDRNHSYVQFYQFLLDHFEIDKQTAEDLTEECIYIARSGESPNQAMELLSEYVEFDSKETIQLVMNHMAELMNNTREWFLKGYTPSQLADQEKKQLLPLPHSPKKSQKVGRNDPCPCGSGKKYKKCCGR